MTEPLSTKERILLVDDVVEITDACRRMMATQYDVSVANSGAEALELCRDSEPFAVVISDDDMPEMTGREFLSKVCQEFPHTVRVMLTGRKDLDVAVDAIEKGQIFRFLTKPFTFDGLKEAIDEALDVYHDLRGTEEERVRLRTDNETLQDSNATLEERVAAQTAILDRLHRFAVDLNAATTLEEIAGLAADAVTATLHGRGTHVQIWDPSSNGIGVEASRGPEMSSEMFREPLRTKEGPLGEIVVDKYDTLGKNLDERDLGTLASIVSSTAVAAHNEFRRGERDRAQHATIMALARLAEQRDNETGKHLERVSLYCKLLAEGLRERGHYTDEITDAFIEDIVRSSPLHDIGKVGIPDSILLKPGKLTPEEWVIMKTHAEIGAATLDSVIADNPDQSFLKMARDIAWCHHEKWNGEGYPRGLAEEQIPLSARILTLADVYDALTTVRPYKGAWTHEEALEWIESYSGSHFDPKLVEVLTDHERDANRIRERLADKIEDVTDKSLATPIGTS